jgi:hypothetical protein
MKQESIKARADRIRELYRKKAYKREIKTGKAQPFITDAQSPTDAVSLITGLEGGEAYSASREIDSSDEPSSYLSNLVKDMDDATLNYVYAQSSYKYFGKKYLPHLIDKGFTEKYHDILFETLRAVETHSIFTPAAVAGPREWGKSLLSANLMPLHSVVFPVFQYFPGGRQLDISKKYIIWLSLNRDKAQDHLATVCGELEDNEEIRNDFGEFYRDPDRKLAHKKDKPWSKVMAITLNGKRLEAQGRKGKIRGALWKGKRPDCIIGDDLDDDEVSNTKTKRDRDYNWLMRTVINSMNDKTGNLLILGNYVNPNGMFSRVLHKGLDLGWRCHIFKQYELDPDTNEKIFTWPEEYGTEFEDRKKAIIGEEAYRIEFQQDPESYDRDITQDSFHYYDRDEVFPKMHKYITFSAIDPAPTVNRTSDLTAIVSVTFDPVTKVCYVLPSDIDKISLIEQPDRILDAVRRWDPYVFGVESVAFQAALHVSLTERAQELGVPINTEPITQYGQGRKRPRIAHRLFFGIENGLIRFLKGDPSHDIIISQLVNLRYTDKDDGADALEMAVRLKDDWVLDNRKRKGSVRANILRGTGGKSKSTGRVRFRELT